MPGVIFDCLLTLTFRLGAATGLTTSSRRGQRTVHNAVLGVQIHGPATWMKYQGQIVIGRGASALSVAMKKYPVLAI
jgi:hypothetical protein